MKRPAGVTVIAAYHFFRVALMLLGIAALIALPFLVNVSAPGDRDAFVWTSFFSVIGIVFLGLALVVNLVVGLGLLRLKEWARITSIVLGVLRLLAFPIGTVIGVLTIWYLLQEHVSEEFRR